MPPASGELATATPNSTDRLALRHLRQVIIRPHQPGCAHEDLAASIFNAVAADHRGPGVRPPDPRNCHCSSAAPLALPCPPCAGLQGSPPCQDRAFVADDTPSSCRGGASCSSPRRRRPPKNNVRPRKRERNLRRHPRRGCDPHGAPRRRHSSRIPAHGPCFDPEDREIHRPPQPTSSQRPASTRPEGPRARHRAGSTTIKAVVIGSQDASSSPYASTSRAILDIVRAVRSALPEGCEIGARARPAQRARSRPPSQGKIETTYRAAEFIC